MYTTKKGAAIKWASCIRERNIENFPIFVFVRLFRYCFKEIFDFLWILNFGSYCFVKRRAEVILAIPAIRNKIEKPSKSSPFVSK